MFSDLKGLFAAQHHGLQHFMRRHVGFEVTRVPELAHELAEALHQQKHDVTRRPADFAIVVLLEEVVP